MKILSDSYKMENGLEMLKTFERLELKYSDVSEFLTPVAVLSTPHYHDHAVIGYYPTTECQLASLVFLGYERFMKYLESFNNFLVEMKSPMNCEALVKAFRGMFESGLIKNDLSLIGSFSKIVEVFHNNRLAFSEFVSCLKFYSPSAVTKEYKSIRDVNTDNIDRFYVAYILSYQTDCDHNCIFSCSKLVELSCVELQNNSKLTESEMKTIKDSVKTIEEFNLEIAFSNMNQQLNVKKSSQAYSNLHYLLYSLFEKWGY